MAKLSPRQSALHRESPWGTTAARISSLSGPPVFPPPQRLRIPVLVSAVPTWISRADFSSSEGSGTCPHPSFRRQLRTGAVIGIDLVVAAGDPERRSRSVQRYPSSNGSYLDRNNSNGIQDACCDRHSLRRRRPILESPRNIEVIVPEAFAAEDDPASMFQ